MPKGKLIWKGWSTRADQIPQPVSIIFGANLRPKAEKPLDLLNLEKDPAEAAAEHSDWITKLNRRKRKTNTSGHKGPKGGVK